MRETGMPNIAPLRNVTLCLQAIDRAMNAPRHLPRIVEFHGPPGIGKTVGATYAANEYRAYYVEYKSIWTKKAFLHHISKEMGLPKEGTINDLFERVTEHLALSGRPLIIDEMDHMVARKDVEIVRDIYEGSQAVIMLIGEEKLPSKLREWERFHSRILDFVPAQLANIDDARILAEFYCHRIEIEDDLLASLVDATGGSIRRICINLARFEEEAMGAGQQVMNLAIWRALKKGFWTGESPERPYR